MIVFNNYKQYQAAFTAGHRDIKFESLNTAVAKPSNPVFSDSGVSALAMQSGDY